MCVPFIGRGLGSSNIYYGVPAVAFVVYMTHQFVHSLHTTIVVEYSIYFTPTSEEVCTAEIYAALDS